MATQLDFDADRLKRVLRLDQITKEIGTNLLSLVGQGNENDRESVEDLYRAFIKLVQDTPDLAPNPIKAKLRNLVMEFTATDLKGPGDKKDASSTE